MSFSVFHSFQKSGVLLEKITTVNFEFIWVFNHIVETSASQQMLIDCYFIRVSLPGNDLSRTARGMKIRLEGES